MDLSRQIDLLNPNKLDYPINIIGVGGLGSPVATCIAKMGFTDLTIFDHDRVEPHNLPNQLYRKSDMGRLKSRAMANILAAYADVEVKSQGRYIDQTLRGVVISAVDSMVARQEIWREMLQQRNVHLYIEARMMARVFRINIVKMDSYVERGLYESTLDYSGLNPVEEPCTARAIFYNVLPCAGYIGNQVARYVSGEQVYREIIFDFVSYSLVVDKGTQ